MYAQYERSIMIIKINKYLHVRKPGIIHHNVRGRGTSTDMWVRVGVGHSSPPE